MVALPASRPVVSFEVVSTRRASAVVVRPSPSLPHRWGGRPAPCAHLQVGWYSLSPCDLRERPCYGPDAEGVMAQL